MRILFAAPDRDLLECYKKLLETDLGETVTAFDGTQVISLFAAKSFDIVILDRELPRIEHKALVERINATGTPVIVLTDEQVSAHSLTECPLPNAYLTYPFTFAQMKETLCDVLEKVSSKEKLDVFGAEIDVSNFKFTDGPKLTSDEINVLRSLLHNERLTTDHGAYISALNCKFAQVGIKTRIRYMAKKGFEPVTENE